MDRIEPDEGDEEAYPPGNPALEGPLARRHAAADGDSPHREQEHLPRLELQREQQDDGNERDQKQDTDPVAEERRRDRRPQRQAAFAPHGKRVPLDHGRDGIGRARNVDQDRRDGAPKHAAGVDAKHEHERHVLAHARRKPDQERHRHGRREPRHRPPENAERGSRQAHQEHVRRHGELYERPVHR